MKKNPFTYLKRAPKLDGHRVLRPTERIRAGDFYAFLCVVDAITGGFSLDRGSLGIAPDAVGCHIHVGGTLQDARKTFGPGFDGVVYRPLKK
jgi:hypothetical protein